MKKKTAHILTLLLCMMSFAGSATTYYNKSSGAAALHTLSNWGTNTDGTGTAPANFTTSGDIFNIYNGSPTTIGGNWTLASGVTINIGNGVTPMTFTQPGNNITTAATANVRAGSTFIIRDITTPTLGTLALTSTVMYDASVNFTIPAATFGNLTYSSSNNSSSFAVGTITILGDFSIEDGTVTINKTAATSTTVNVSGDFSMSGNARMVLASNASASATINVDGTTTINSTGATLLNFQSATSTTGVSVFQANGNVSISGGGTNLIDWGNGVIANNTFGVKGNLTISGTKIIKTTSSASAAQGFIFNGTGAVQTLTNTSTGSAANTECSYQVNSGAYVRLGAALSLGTGTTIHSDFTVLNGGTLDCATYVISGGSTGGGGVQIGSGSRLVTAHTGGINSSVTATGSAFSGGANYEFNASSSQVTGTSMPAAIVSPGSVTINNSSGVTLSQATTFATGDTLNLENGTFTNSTNLSMSSGSYVVRDNGTLSATPTTYSGVNLSYANLGNNALAVTTGNEFPASFTGSVTVNKTGATITLNNTKTLTGALTLTAGTLDASVSNYNLSLTGNWTNNSATSAFTPRSGTVTMSGSSAQSIGGSFSTSFTNLTNSNAGAAVSVNTNINVSGTLNMNGAATVLTPAATVVFNSAAAAGTISGSGTIQVTRITATADYVNQYKFSTNTLTGMTVDYAGAGAQTINSTVGSYGNLKTSTSGIKTLAGAVVVITDVTIGASTTLDASASNYQLTVGDDWTNSGTFTARSGTVLFNATTTGQLLSGSMTGSNKFYNLTFNGSGGAWSFGSAAADAGNNFTITTGTVTATSATLQVAGNWSNSAAFTHNSGTVIFNGTTAQVIGGSSATSFNNLTNSNTSAAVSVNTNVNITGTLNMNGAATILAPAATVVFNSAAAAGTISGSGTIQVTRITATADYVNQYKFSTNTLTGMTVDYAGAGAQTINSTVGSYGNLKTSASGTKTLAGAVVVNADVTIGASSILDVSASNHQITAGGSWTNSGTFTARSGTVLLNAATTGKTLSGSMTGSNKFYNLTFNGSGGAWSFGAVAAEAGNNFTITTGTVTATSATLQVAGNWSNNAAFTHNSGTVTFNGTVAQAIGGSSVTSFNNLTNSNTSAAVAVNTNINISGTLSMNGAATILAPSATVVFNSAAAAGTISGSGTIQVTRITATADYANQYKFSTNTLTGLTVDYAGAGAQTVNSNVGNYGSLKTSGSGTKTLAGAVVVNNDITIGGSTTLDVSTGNYQLTIGGSWTNSGTFAAQAGTVLFNATTTGKTLSGSMTGTNKFNILTFNGSGGAWSFSTNPADIGSNLTITAGTVTAPSTTLQVAGNWNNSGAFTHNNGTIVMNATATGKTLSGSMTGSNKFHALTFNGSGGAWSFGAAAAETENNFTITAGTVTAPSSTLQVAGNWSNSGTFTHNSGLVTLSRTGTQSIGGSAGTAFNSLTIGSASVTTISTAGQTVRSILQCNDTLNSNGNLTLLSTSAQTALIDGSGTGKVLGNVTMQRYLDSSFGYRYISSPHQAATLGQLSGNVNLSAIFPAFYAYDENVNYAGYIIDTAMADTLEPMHGYVANFGTSHSSSTFSLTGVVNNGSMSYTLYNHNQPYTLGYNLVGNPYPSPINWTASSGWTKTNIDNAVYYFNHGDTNQYYGRYSSYVAGVSSDGIANNIIPAMQGFFVHVSNGSYPVTGTLGFTNTVRTTGLNAHYFKQTASGDKPLIRIDAGFSNDGANSDPAVIYFDELGTNNFDRELDALKLINTDETIPSLYSVSADENKLSIQALPPLSDSVTVVPLGLQTAVSGLVTFNTRTVENIPPGMHAWFYDVKTGNIQDLVTDPKYQVSIGSGRSDNRFFLMFTTKNKEHIPGINSGLNAYSSGGSLFVYLMLGKGTLVVTNTAGQEVGRQYLTGTGYKEVKLQVSSGIYIATLYSDMGKQSKKIFIGNQ